MMWSKLIQRNVATLCLMLVLSMAISISACNGEKEAQKKEMPAPKVVVPPPAPSVHPAIPKAQESTPRAKQMELLPPGPLSHIWAVAGDGEVELHWNKVKGASSYAIYSSPTPNVSQETAQKTIGIKGTSHKLTGLANGVASHFRISAANRAGEGPLEVEIAAVPQAANPSAPDGLAITVADGKILLRWTAVSGATGYDVYTADAPDSEDGAWSKLAEVTESAFEHSPPKREAIYFYRIVAKIGTAESIPSLTVGSTP